VSSQGLELEPATANMQKLETRRSFWTMGSAWVEGVILAVIVPRCGIDVADIDSFAAALVVCIVILRYMVLRRRSLEDNQAGPGRICLCHGGSEPKCFGR
jgi:hypothetical protein